MLSTRKTVREMHEYHPPLAGRNGLRLDFNENTEGCSACVLERIRQITADELARYPEREPVEGIVAAHLGLPPEQVLLTNGVDEAIHLLCEAYLERAHEVMVVTPTFSMYEIFAAAPQAAVFVDEAYFEFHGKTVMSDVVAQPYLFVARTFSKAHGLAGLRIGILAGPAKQMPMVRRVSSPYSVNAIALAALPVALADKA